MEPVTAPPAPVAPEPVPVAPVEPAPVATPPAAEPAHEAVAVPVEAPVAPVWQTDPILAIALSIITLLTGGGSVHWWHKRKKK